MSDFVIGTPVFENNYKKKNYFFLNEGSNIYRILPPCFSCAASGKWATKYRVHKGVVGVSGKSRLFVCPEVYDFEQRRIVKRCPECAKIDEVLALFESQKIELSKSGGDLAQLAPLADFTNFKTGHSLETRWHMNVLNQDNKIGKLTVQLKMKAALDKGISKLKSRNLDPLAVWWNMEVTKQPTSNFEANPQTEMTTINGDQYERIKVANLNDETIDRMKSEAFDLSALFATPTIEQVQLLIDSGYDPEVVDRVFSVRKDTDDNLEGVGTSLPNLPNGVSIMPNPNVTTTIGGTTTTTMSVEQFKTMFGPRK